MLHQANLTFDRILLNKTTGWHNNCGLNCLSHFLISKLQDSSDFFSQDPAYTSLLETFAQYYGVSGSLTWGDINSLFQVNYTNPTDREAIFGPVLRTHLEKILLQNAEELWDTFCAAAFSDYMVTGEVHDVARPIFLANKEVFEWFKAEFQEQLSANANTLPTKLEEAEADARFHANYKRVPNPEERADLIQFQRKILLQNEMNENARLYWLSEGCTKYAQVMGNLHFSELISVNQLELLADTLSIQVKAYTPETINQLMTTEPAQGWVLIVYNRGLHWEYITPNCNNDETTAHNRHYPNDLTLDYYRNNVLSGIFKIYASDIDIAPKVIIHVNEHLENKILDRTHGASTSMETALLRFKEKLDILKQQGIIRACEKDNHVLSFLSAQPNTDSNRPRM